MNKLSAPVHVCQGFLEACGRGTEPYKAKIHSHHFAGCKSANSPQRAYHFPPNTGLACSQVSKLRRRQVVLVSTRRAVQRSKSSHTYSKQPVCKCLGLAAFRRFRGLRKGETGRAQTAQRNFSTLSQESSMANGGLQAMTVGQLTCRSSQSSTLCPSQDSTP